MMGNYSKYAGLFASLEQDIARFFSEIDQIVLQNQARVLSAFQEEKIDESCFYESAGYGYNDRGREKLDRLYARVFGAEAALVRPHFVSGTHAIMSCLYAIVPPGGRLVSLTGKPYDTLQRSLGLSGHGGNPHYPIRYAQTDLTEKIAEDELDIVLREKADAVLLQRSRGYARRRALTINDLDKIIKGVRNRRPDAIVFVDNCYGEFVQAGEPSSVGADLVAGSLIKNPGGGLAAGGGYVAGHAHLVDKVAQQLTAPGLGSGIGAMGGAKRLYYQGLFMAPHQVGQILKGMVLTAALFERIGYNVSPQAAAERGDIVQSIRLDNREQLVSFCRAVQSASPVDSHLTPQPAPMLGYEDEVIMAAGTFIQGAGSEFSADAPLRPPYDIYLQGGLSYEHVKLALAAILSELGVKRSG